MIGNRSTFITGPLNLNKMNNDNMIIEGVVFGNKEFDILEKLLYDQFLNDGNDLS